jgi:hypothetical protein
MTTLTEYLKANPDMTEVVIAKRYNVGDTTTKSLVLGIDAEFRAKLALIDVLDNYLAIKMASQMSDDRVQDMIDHSLGELKFTVNVE